MATWQDFMPHILPYVAGCSYPLAEQQLRAITLDFCTQAPIVQETLEPIDMPAGQREYELDLPMGSDLACILEARFQGMHLPIVRHADCRANAVGTPTGLAQNPGNGFMLDQAPGESIAQALLLRVSTKPARTASRVADILLTDYAYEIGQGVVGRLMLLPGQSFSAPDLAPLYTATYLVARTNARIRADRGFGPVGMRALTRRFM